MLRYKYLLNSRRRKYASLAVSIALAHASFGQVRYRSLGNGMADIDLTLEENQKFQLHFTRLDEEKEYIMKGKWTRAEDDFILKFRRTRIDLPTLFESNTGSEAHPVIEDKRTVRIPTKRNGLVIWGIYCSKV